MSESPITSSLPISSSLTGSQRFSLWLRDQISIPLAAILYLATNKNHKRIRDDYKNITSVPNVTKVNFPVWKLQRSFARMLVDFAWVIKRPEKTTDFFQAERSPVLEKISQDIRENKTPGHILLFAHHGSFPLGGGMLSSHGIHPSAIANEQKGLSKWMLHKMTEPFGIELMKVKKQNSAEGTSGTYDKMKELLSAGKPIIVAGDFYSPTRATGGTFVDLAGKQRRIGSSIAQLAIETGAKITVIGIQQTGWKRTPIAFETIDPNSLAVRQSRDPRGYVTKLFTRQVENLVTQGKPQWYCIADMMSDVFGKAPWRESPIAPTYSPRPVDTRSLADTRTHTTGNDLSTLSTTSSATRTTAPNLSVGTGAVRTNADAQTTTASIPSVGANVDEVHPPDAVATSVPPAPTTRDLWRL